MDEPSLSGGASRVVPHRRVAGLCALLIGGWPGAGVAQFTGTPHAAVDVEHNSNVFDLSSSGTAPQGKNGPTFGDTTIQARGGFDASYLLGQQKFFAVAELQVWADDPAGIGICKALGFEQVDVGYRYRKIDAGG